MSGQLVAQASKQLSRGTQQWTLPLTAAQRERLRDRGHLLISYETTNNEAQAFDVNVSR